MAVSFFAKVLATPFTSTQLTERPPRFPVIPRSPQNWRAGFAETLIYPHRNPAKDVDYHFSHIYDKKQQDQGGIRKRLMSWKLKDKVKRRLAKERGTIYKSAGDKIKVALIYPNHYSIGMANLGFQTVYGLLNDLPYVLCEPAFFPDPEDLIEYKRQKAALFSYESQRPLYDFDLLAFSVAFFVGG